MPYPLDRIQASVERVLELSDDNEAMAVLELNDGAAHARQGKFFYLPESTTPNEKSSNPNIKMASRVPRLLYVHHNWTEHEYTKYQQSGDADRFLFIQGTLQ